jgi:cysteine desulfurase family protein
MIYLDNGATTFPKPNSVVRAVNDALITKGANPGRSGHKMSLKAAEIMYNCRFNAAKLFGVSSPEKVIILNNCTTALNTVIKGILKKGDHAVISSLEHNAVVRPLETLKSQGITYSVAQFEPYDEEKTIDNFRNAINGNTKLVICTHASNVFGFKLPVERIGALCRIYGILFCVDAAQSAGVVPINLENSCIDFLCTAGHKGLYGPMGTGLLIINNEITPDSLIQGGTGSLSAELSQPEILPDKYESGTPNLIGVAGLNEGIKFVLKHSVESIEAQEISLIQLLYDRLSSQKNVIFYTKRPEKSHFVPVLSFNINGLDSEETARILSERFNIAVRAGLHCAPLAHKSFNTLENGTVRAVASVFTTKEQINYFASCINKIINLKK